MTELTRAELGKDWASGLPRLTDGRGRGSGVAATSTDTASRTQPILTTWFLACRLRQVCRPCGLPTGMRPDGSMAELEMARLAVPGPGTRTGNARSPSISGPPTTRRRSAPRSGGERQFRLRHDTTR